jgi:hypothetical protein
MKIKYPAVLVATLIHYALGALWYSPLLFGNRFIRIIGWTPEQIQQLQAKSPARELIIAFLTSVVLVYILAHFVQYTKAVTVRGGIETAFWLWLGFIVTTNLATVLFEQRPLGLYLINVGYQLVGCALAGVVLAVWRAQEAPQSAAQAARN